MARKWRELAPSFFHATATTPLFFKLAPPRYAPPFLVCASGAVALKVAQVPSTGYTINKTVFRVLFIKRNTLPSSVVSGQPCMEGSHTCHDPSPLPTYRHLCRFFVTNPIFLEFLRYASESFYFTFWLTAKEKTRVPTSSTKIVLLNNVFHFMTDGMRPLY